jgi:hypothetical protein
MIALLISRPTIRAFFGQAIGIQGIFAPKCGRRRRRTGLQRGKPLRDLALGADGDMDIAGLKDAADGGGLVRCAAAQPHSLRRSGTRRRRSRPRGIRGGRKARLPERTRPLRSRRRSFVKIALCRLTNPASRATIACFAPATLELTVVLRGARDSPFLWVRPAPPGKQ